MATGGSDWDKLLVPLNGAPCCWQMVSLSLSLSLSLSEMVLFQVNKADQSQISATELLDGRVLAMLRPDSWEETMWEVWSSDVSTEGRSFSWGPLARGHFPMYASPNAMLTTSKGVLLIGNSQQRAQQPLLLQAISSLLWKTDCLGHGTILQEVGSRQ